MEGFVRVKDESVVMVWACEKCNLDVEITPPQVADGGTPICGRCGDDMKYVETRVKTPRAIVFVEGGVVHDVIADAPVTLRIIDYDCEDCDKSVMIKLPGSEKGELEQCVVAKHDLDGEEDLEPLFKQAAIR